MTHEEMLETQMKACQQLAYNLAKKSISCVLMWFPGDAPLVRVKHLDDYEICSDAKGVYDIWSIRPQRLIYPDLSLDEAILFFSPPVNPHTT